MTSAKQMIITLFVVALVCSIVLSFVYSFTEPRIDETQRQLTLAGLREVIDAQDFAEVIPETLWQAIDSSGNHVGIVFRVFPQGYGGPIPTTVGLNFDSAITGVRIASAAEGMKETPGLGAKITENAFTEQFKGKCASAIQVKQDGGEIDAITAATISSRAVCAGIKDGIGRYSHYLGKEQIDKKSVYAEAQDFMEIIDDTLWYAVRDGDTIGIVFLSVADGYADRIEFLVGVNMRGKITGVEIVYVNETPGIGEMIGDRAFLDAFKKKIPDTITGATVSSKAIINAIKNNLKRFKEYLK